MLTVKRHLKWSNRRRCGSRFSGILEGAKIVCSAGQSILPAVDGHRFLSLHDETSSIGCKFDLKRVVVRACLDHAGERRFPVQALRHEEKAARIPESNRSLGRVARPSITRLIRQVLASRMRGFTGRWLPEFNQGRIDDFMMGSLARTENLQRLEDEAVWDVVVIGGGATGLGSAVDAAARGYRTLLLESQDFAHGTSSRSTKLIHGGVRYLAQGNVALVREALAERGHLLRNVPQLVHPRDFVVPAYHWHELPYYGTGLKLYDLLAGRQRLGWSGWISRSEVLKRIPTIRRNGLHGGIRYTDAQFDDSRLAVTLARTLTDLGGTALNYAAVVSFTKRDGRIAGLIARDVETGLERRLQARVVINATGVFVDTVRRLDDPNAEPLLTLSRGAHLVLDRSFMPGDTALMVPRTDDGRVIFAIPWHGHVLVGTTDTPTNDLTNEPQSSHADVAYLTDYVGRYLDRRPAPADILSTYAGLRPLLRGQAGSQTWKLSREHAVVVSASGLITVTGGKWTTYRRMAIDAVDQAARVAHLTSVPSPTATLRLHGWQQDVAHGDDPLSVYGSDAPELKALGALRPEWNQLLHPSLPYRASEVIWVVRHEAARSVQDVLARRTRALFLDARASIEAAPVVARLLAAELGRDQAWEAQQIAEFRTLATGYRPSP
jgi:glycerol-3-phosphate dehydrogenase